MKIAEKSIWKYRIVCCESAWGRKCALRIRTAIAKKTGIALQIVPDTAEPRECEILVGKVNRQEVEDIRAGYDRPNIYYDVKVVNSKLVCVGEGFCTLDKIAATLESYILACDDINGEIVHGDFCDDPDADMIDRADGTDIRMLDWNLNAPANTGENWRENAERTADVMLRHLPDIIGTNEMYNSRNCGSYKRFYDAVVRELDPYYAVLESDYDEGQSLENISGDPERYGIPPENIFFRKNVGLEPLRSGYRYTPNLIAYHGYHWAIFKNASDKKFIFSVGHYEESRNNTTCAVGHMETMRFAQSLSGEAESLPEVITGDLFTHYGCHDGGYDAFINAGYLDSQRDAVINCNGDISASTYHHPGKYSPRWASIDLVLCKFGARALKFKVITSQEALDVSDHCPVCADIKFN